VTATVERPDTPAEHGDWAAANQQYLVAAIAEVAAALEHHLGVEPSARATNGPPAGLSPPPALNRVTEAFGLSHFERDVLVMCAGVELDARVASLCGTGPTFGLTLAALEDAHWSAITPAAPLRRWRLIEVPGNGPLTNATLRVDEHVLHVLAGVPGADPRLTGVVSSVPAVAGTTPGQTPAAHTLADLWRTHEGPVGVLTGADRDTRIAVAAHAAADLGMFLALLDPRALPTDPGTREELARLLERESVLSSRAFVLECGTDTVPAVDALLSLTSAPLVVSAADPPALRRSSTLIVDVPRPTALEQRELWRALTADEAPIDALVAAFDLSCSTIRTATMTAGPDPAALWNACRVLDRPDLSAHAQRIESDATWEDLVVAPAQHQALALLTTHARHRVTVYEDWGMRMGRATGLGSTAVFGGPSGTGKTFAAEVIANDLGLDLYRVDLSAVVSKYIGETEKNLRRVFDAADHGAAVLLFDEADALFGKRTEVKDSHDRYANVEVSYLLQRMEAYRGLAILTTNMVDAIDTAFLRRVRFLVTFPFPDREMRVELWRRAFAASTPTDGLNIDILAQLELAGGTIRNVAVNAAFLAAEAGDPVRMGHVVQAARIEAGKLGQPMPSLKWEVSS
jgi:AAA+ superfamily predicted ATPase